MKRVILMMAAVFSVFILLAGCSSDLGTTVNQKIEDWRPDEKGNGKASIEVYDEPAFSKSLGFDVVTYPNSRELNPYKFFVIDLWFGQIQYKTADGRVLVVRIAKEDSSSLSETYAEIHNQKKEMRTIDGVEATTGWSSDGCVLTSWKRNGFQYTVHSNENQDPPTTAEIDELVKVLDCAVVPKK